MGWKQTKYFVCLASGFVSVSIRPQIVVGLGTAVVVCVWCCVCVCVFFTLTDRVSSMPNNILRGCQSGTWSAGQYVDSIRNIYYVVPVLPCVSCPV